MSVNVSMRQLASPDLVDDVSAALEESALHPSRLTIEVTESVLMRDADATVAHLRRLKEVGVMIAIDDFGSGQSSLTYLRRFPIDELKIDRSFIAAIDGSRESWRSCTPWSSSGQTLGLSIVAEGIETCAQLDGLRSRALRLRPRVHLRPPAGAQGHRATLVLGGCGGGGGGGRGRDGRQHRCPRRRIRSFGK
jgi:EAL domain-containing protein (putative c-di-GMP-specific phosphodiesterase class I)